MREHYASVRLDEKRDAVGNVVRLIAGGDSGGDPPKKENRVANLHVGTTRNS